MRFDVSMSRCDDPEATDHKIKRHPAEAVADASVAMQAKRDRQRIIAAQAEIAAMCQRVWELENAPSGRALAPARKLYHTARRLMSGSPAAPQPPAVPAAPGLAADTRGQALVVDHHWPEPDRDSGSIDIVNLVQALANLGFEVALAATEEPAGSSPAREKLEALGIRCLQPEIDGTLEAYLGRHGADIDLCVLCRVYCGGAFLETVQRRCGRARIVFNSIDLNFLREERRAKLLNDDRLRNLLPDLRAREEHIIRESDATILVSDAEMALVRETIPEAFCLTMPLARPILAPVRPFAERRGVGFIGGFAHAPNVDAITAFLRDVWPLALQTLPDCALSIVGAGFPQALLDGCPGHVIVRGHVPDVGPWFESLRATVAPLRFGAGAKGKVASSLAAGVPAVVSEVAAEGMGLDQGCGVLVARDAAEFAACIARVDTDAELWAQLSEEALAYAHRTLSLDGWQRRLDQILLRLGL
jgi:glycosyltransferase involved in cell wall biosynthesis